MKWSRKIGTFWGIDVYVHATFFLLIGWLILTHVMAGRSVITATVGVGLTLCVFGCVLLHEFGHALTARRFGIRTREITLLPIGGVARLERMPENPHHELWVALAGPAVNVVIAIGLYVVLLMQANLVPVRSLGVVSGPFLERLLIANLFLVGFNMLPAFPMDGGRVVRALLATRMEYARATQIAARLGQGMALLFGFLGLFTNPFLLFIALFVWIGAASESSVAQMKSALGGIPVEQAMMTRFEVVSPDQPLKEVVELILAGSQQDFPVVENDRILGVLTRSDLMAALAQTGQEVPVSKVMRSDFQNVDSSEMLMDVFSRLQECPCRVLPVTHGGRLVGLLTSDNLGEFIMIQAALGETRLRHAAASYQPT